MLLTILEFYNEKNNNTIFGAICKPISYFSYNLKTNIFIKKIFDWLSFKKKAYDWISRLTYDYVLYAW